MKLQNIIAEIILRYSLRDSFHAPVTDDEWKTEAKRRFETDPFLKHYVGRVLKEVEGNIDDDGAKEDATDRFAFLVATVLSAMIPRNRQHYDIPDEHIFAAADAAARVRWESEKQADRNAEITDAQRKLKSGHGAGSYIPPTSAIPPPNHDEIRLVKARAEEAAKHAFSSWADRLVENANQNWICLFPNQTFNRVKGTIDDVRSRNRSAIAIIPDCDLK